MSDFGTVWFAWWAAWAAGALACMAWLVVKHKRNPKRTQELFDQHGVPQEAAWLFYVAAAAMWPVILVVKPFERAMPRRPCPGSPPRILWSRKGSAYRCRCAPWARPPESPGAASARQ